MSGKYKQDNRIYILPDGDTVVFSREAHRYVLSQYGTPGPYLGNRTRSEELINDLKRDRFLRVSEVSGGLTIARSKRIPPELKRILPTTPNIEGLLEAVDTRRDQDFEDSNLPEGVGACNWQ